MKLPTSDKTSSFGKKPYIKKGYYPGQLLKVELFADKDGEAKVGKYGKQLIFEFAVYKKDPETDEPISPMMFVPEEGKEEVPVKIAKFAYHEYKVIDKETGKWTGKFQTAITPNSAITKLLKALGWSFSADGVDPEEFVDQWVELNIDDYEQGEGDEAYTASTIKDVNPYEGPEIKEVPKVKATEKPKEVKKQVKHEETKKEETSEEDPEIEKLEKKKEDLKNLNKDGLLTDDGLKMSLEQLDSKIETLRKK